MSQVGCELLKFTAQFCIVAREQLGEWDGASLLAGERPEVDFAFGGKCEIGQSCSELLDQDAVVGGFSGNGDVMKGFYLSTS